jgi:hypothetical protein
MYPGLSISVNEYATLRGRVASPTANPGIEGETRCTT